MTIRNFVPAAAAFLVLGAAGFLAHDVSAQPMWDQVKVHLPYSVTIGDKTMPPGDYLIKQLDDPDGSSPVLLIYGNNGMKFKTSAMTIHTVDVKTPTKTDVTLHRIGDNYYLDKIWIAGKNSGYEIPLPARVRERATEAASISVPSEAQSSSETTTTETTANNTATTDESSNTSTSTAVEAPAPPPPPPPEPAVSAPQEQQPAPPPPPPVTDDNSANREAPPAPNMPTTSADWLVMLLSGGTLSGAGLMLRRRKQ